MESKPACRQATDIPKKPKAFGLEVARTSPCPHLTLTASRPSMGLSATAVTGPECPVSVWRCRPLVASHTCSERSAPAATTWGGAGGNGRRVWGSKGLSPRQQFGRLGARWKTVRHWWHQAVDLHGDNLGIRYR